MSSIKRDSILKAGIVTVALSAIALATAPVARAQAMGEYGAVVGESAGAATQAPHADLPALPAQHDSSGSTTTEIREDDSSSGDRASDRDSGQSGDEWTEVHGSGDDDQPGN